jgi:hypothetical protein
MPGLFGQLPFNLALGGATALSQLFADRQFNEAEQARLETVLGDIDRLQQMKMGHLADDYASQSTRLATDTRNALDSLRKVGSDSVNRFGQFAAGNLADYGRMAGNINAWSGDRASQVMGDFDSRNSDYVRWMQDRGNNLVGEFDTRQGDLVKGFDARYQRGLANLEGAGRQARNDIDRDYQALQGKTQQDMYSRGLQNSTVAQGQRQAVERERQGAIGRLNEQLRQERAATDASLSGDTLNAQSAGNTARAALRQGLTGDVGNALASGNTNRTNLQVGLTGDVLNTKTGLAQGKFDLGRGYGLTQIGMQDQNARDVWNTGQNYATEGRNLMADYYGRRFGFDTDMGLKHIDTLASVESAPPDQGYFGSIMQSLGQGYGMRQYLQSMMSPGGMASWDGAQNLLPMGGLNYNNRTGLGYGVGLGF